MVGVLDDPFGLKKKRKSISTKDRMRIAKGFDMKCAKCGRRLKSRDDFHVDHRKPNPSSRDIVNLQPLCIKCHREKSAKEAKKRAKKKGVLDNPLGF